MIVLISKDIEENKARFYSEFNNSSDLVTRQLQTLCKTEVMVCYINGFIDKEALNDQLLPYQLLNLQHMELV